MFKIAFFTIALLASTVRGGFKSDIVEQIGYSAVKTAIISAGKSEEYAKCVIQILKWTGTTQDVTDIRNIVDPQKMLHKLETKAQVAEFVCSNGGILVLAALFIVILVFFACCCVKCCCSRRKPMIIQLGRPAMHLGFEVPYNRMDKV